MRPSDFNRLIKLAAKQTYYPLCLQFIEDNLEEGFHDLATATLPYYLCSNILDLPSKEERTAAIDSIPLNATPSHTRQLVENGVMTLWRRNRKRNGV